MLIHEEYEALMIIKTFAGFSKKGKKIMIPFSSLFFQILI
jgi:hypothetical protein